VVSGAADDISRFCLLGFREPRNLTQLSSLRSLSVSKILKAELQNLPVRLQEIDNIPADLSPNHLAPGLLTDLVIEDFWPLVTYLTVREENLSWLELKAIASCSEKSTQGRTISKLGANDFSGLALALMRGIEKFDAERGFSSSKMLTKGNAQYATLSFLRASINLTNSSGEICEALSKDLKLATALTNVITAAPEQFSDAYQEKNDSLLMSSVAEPGENNFKESRFDLLLLSLGLLINFVQESTKVKEMLLSATLADEIKGTFEKLISRDVYSLSAHESNHRNLRIMRLDI
jgi:hypothetical protein